MGVQIKLCNPLTKRAILERFCDEVFLGKGGGGVVVSLSDLGSIGLGFNPWAVPRSEFMFVNIYHY